MSEQRVEGAGSAAADADLALMAALRRDGYVAARGWLASGIGAIDAAVKRLATVVAPGLPATTVSYETDGTTLKSISNLHQHEPQFADLWGDGPFARFASALFADQVELLQMQYFAKAARVGSGAPWHQDNAYRFLQPPEQLVFWFPLTPARRDNGCLHYARGSHHHGLFPHVPSGLDGFSQKLAKAPDAKRYPHDQVEAEPGDCLIHFGDMAHSSGPNSSGDPRRAIQIACRSRRAEPDRQRVAAYQRQLEQLKAQVGKPPPADASPTTSTP